MIVEYLIYLTMMMTIMKLKKTIKNKDNKGWEIIPLQFHEANQKTYLKSLMQLI